jgi:hypothetical protein
MLLILAVGQPASAQERASTGGAETRVAAGLVWQQGVFGDDDPEAGSRLGAIVGVQVRRRTPGRLAASVEFVFQPIGLPNPHFDETLHTFSVIAGPEIGRRWYIRPAGGIALQMWSGSMTESGLNVAIAAGVAVGRRGTAGRIGLNPEFVVRSSGAPGAASLMVGMQLAFGARR